MFSSEHFLNLRHFAGHSETWGRGKRELPRGSPDWETTFEYLETHIGPFPYWFKVDTAVNEGLGKVSSSGTQSVSSDSNRARDLVSFEELDRLDR